MDLCVETSKLRVASRQILRDLMNKMIAALVTHAVVFRILWIFNLTVPTMTTETDALWNTHVGQHAAQHMLPCLSTTDHRNLETPILDHVRSLGDQSSGDHLCWVNGLI